MGFIKPEIIESIKTRLDLLDLVQRYIDLRQSGTRWMGVCPFHQETKPSFSVNPERGLFYCFGCQASGDIIDFYCRINGLEFVEGVKELAREAGVDFQASDYARGDKRQPSLRKQCYEMHVLAQTYFRQSIRDDSSQEVRSYLKHRGLDKDIVESFGLGWSPRSWNGLNYFLKKNGYAPEQGVTAGLLSKNQKGNIYDRFRGRVTFPIYDLSGRVVAFGGRVVDQGEPKYLNSSDTPIFKKGDILFGLYQARRYLTQRQEAILTEGYADVLSLVQNGYLNACGVLGTSLTQKQIHRLAGFVRQIILIFDGDRAGRQAAFRSADMILRYGLRVRVVSLPEDLDVDDVLRQKGPLKLDEYIQGGEEGLTYCLKTISENGSPKQIMGWARDFLNGLPESSWKAYYLPRIAKGLGVSEQELRQELKKNQPGANPDASGKLDCHSSPAQRDRELLRFAIANPEYVNELERQGMNEALGTKRGRTFWAKLLQYGHQEILPYLDDGEKAFFIETEMSPDSEPIEPRILWEDIKGFLQRFRRNREMQTLRESLKKAQDNGDPQEVSRLLQKYNLFLKGKE